MPTCIPIRALQLQDQQVSICHSHTEVPTGSEPLSVTFLAFHVWWLHSLLQAVPVALLPQASSDKDVLALVTSQQLLRGEPLGARQACIVDQGLMRSAPLHVWTTTKWELATGDLFIRHARRTQDMQIGEGCRSSGVS